MYEEHEIHACKKCGLKLRVSFAAVPVEPLQCCGEMMVLVEVNADHVSDKQVDQAKYQVGQKYTCSICGIEVIILKTSAEATNLDCCGEGMELMNN